MLLLQFSFIGLSSVSRSSFSSDNAGSSDFKMISFSSSLYDELSAKWGKRFSLFAVSAITLDFCCRVLRRTGLEFAFGYGAILVKMPISGKPSSDVELVGCSASIEIALLSVTAAGKNI